MYKKRKVYCEDKEKLNINLIIQYIQYTAQYLK